MMVRYYLDQKMAVNLEQHLEQELADLKQTDKDAIDRVLDRTLSATDMAAIQIQELKTVATMLETTSPSRR
jgi:hypothetical protein